MMFSKSEPKRITSSTATVVSAKLRTWIISWHTPAQMKRERVMCSVPRGSTMRPPSPRTSGLVRFTLSSTLSSRGLAASSKRTQAGDRQRETREMPHSGAIQAGLGARLGIDVADLVEQAEAVVVPQRVRAFRARHVGRHHLVRCVQRNGRFRRHRDVTSCK